MLRRLAILGAQFTPGFVKDWIHRHRSVYNGLRRLFGAMAGKQAVEIETGPMKGIRLVPGEHVSHAHLRGIYELETQKAVDRLVQPGFVCYDLGASIGYLSLLMARKASRVFAFEPAPHAAEEIKKHAAANGLANISIVGDPVTDGEREVTFALTDVAFGSGINEKPTEWPTIHLRSTTLDIFTQKNPAPDFIKIDVEGEEGRVLEGARGVLKSKKPLICCELHSVAAAEHVVKVVTEYGYKVFNLDGTPFQIIGNIIAGDLQVICRP